MTPPNMDLCRRVTAHHPYPLVFSTVSGAHLYGFASPDSDYDLRGAHLLPAREVLGLNPTRDTVESEGIVEGVEIDVVTHDAAKFLRLLLKPNGYVLEQLLSPLVVTSSPAHEELRSLAPGCITCFHAHHYLGFANTQWNLFLKEKPHRVKPLLYVYRVLLTGIHLMRTGQVNANLPELNDLYRLRYIPDLIARKTGTHEQTTLDEVDLAFHEAEYVRLCARLTEEHQRTTLPRDRPSAAAINDLLVRLRLGTVEHPG